MHVFEIQSNMYFKQKANNINLYNKELFLGADFYVAVYWGMNRARMLLMKSVIY